MADEYTLRRRRDSDDFAAFDSGDPDLNEFIVEDAARLEAQDVTRIYVAESGGVLVGYVALVADTVVLKTGERKKLDLSYADSKNVPAIKVGRLAVDLRWHGRGAGSQLMKAAYSAAIGARRAVGCRLLTVDSYPKSEPFYLRLKFVRNKSAPDAELCHLCQKPLGNCPHCGAVLFEPDQKTVSMRFDLRTDPLPDWAR